MVVGAGIGGLCCACELAAHGHTVRLIEKESAAGGKARQVEVAGMALDAGPTVLTMLSVFEDLFVRCGHALGDFVSVRPLEILARHAWADGSQLDLHRERDASVAAIREFAGVRQADGFVRFMDDAHSLYARLLPSFMEKRRPNPFAFARGLGVAGLAALLKMNPFATLWSVLDGYFTDPRLRQLFGRYATYCGSSPFEAPSVISLIAAVEEAGVWAIDGGMHSLARALADLAARCGVAIEFDTAVVRMDIQGHSVRAVELSGGECINADAVVFNGDRAALATGLLGDRVTSGVTGYRGRSLSAFTWLGRGQTEGFELAHHNVFFATDYREEFRSIAEDSICEQPTVYICRQHEDERGVGVLCLINAPADGDRHHYADSERAILLERTLAHMERCGLRFTFDDFMAAGPNEFATQFPGTGGALYGEATHGWQSSLSRPSARTRLKNLYLAGGSVHPGAGVPMAALSGHIAATALQEDWS